MSRGGVLRGQDAVIEGIAVREMGFEDRGEDCSSEGLGPAVEDH